MTGRMAGWARAALGGLVEVIPSPNIWHWPAVYEIENHAQDSEGEIWRAIAAAADWADRDVVDVGCGSGFHLPVFADTARTVVGVEPHPPLVKLARNRVAGRENIRVVTGSAGRIPLRDGCADLVHARTAYFFGPGCEPGLHETDRVLRPGGALVIVDLDAAATPYGGWLLADTPGYQVAKVEGFFTAQGFATERVATRWRFDSRADLEAVLRIEFSAAVAARAIAQTTGLTIPVGYRVRVRHKPAGLITV